jgi:hypothetical protein
MFLFALILGLARYLTYFNNTKVQILLLFYLIRFILFM